MIRLWNWLIGRENEPNIHYYAFKNDIESVNRLLERGISINVRDAIKNTLLHVSVKKSHTEMIKFLIQKGIDINASNVLEETALHLAVRRKFYNIVQLLILNGANLEAVSGRGYTPLCEAVLQNDIRMVAYLLDNNANINANTRGMSPILIATKNDFNDITKLLIQKGVNLNGKYINGNTVLHNFILFKRTDMAIYAINNGVDIKAINNNGDTALHLAIKYQLNDVVKTLIDKKAPLDIINAQQETPLLIAIQQERTDIAKYLIKKGASFVYPELSYNMPLTYACRENNIEFVKYLITNGVSPHKNIIKKGQEKPLLDFVVKREDMEVLKLLLDKGLGQEEVLAKLIQNDKSYMIEVLLKQKDIDLESFNDEAKQNISSILAQQNNKAIEKLLTGYIQIQNLDNQNRMMTDDDFMELSESAVYNYSSQIEMEALLARAVQQQNVEIIKSLIQNGANTDGVLFDAVLNNRYQTTKILLDNDANKDVNSEITGKTALYVAVENKNDAMVDLLTKRKYKLNPNNKRDYDGSIQNMEYINDGGLTGETPLELAKRVKRRKIENILEEKNREDIIDILCKSRG